MSRPSAAFDTRPSGPVRGTRLRSSYANLMLWTAQSWLFLFYLAAGYTKLTEPRETLMILLGWPASVSTGLVHLTGALEIALGVLLVMPLLSWRLRTLMIVGAAAIAGLAAIMLWIHLQRAEPGLAFINLVIAGLAFAVLRGRIRPEPQASRSDSRLP